MVKSGARRSIVSSDEVVRLFSRPRNRKKTADTPWLCTWDRPGYLEKLEGVIAIQARGEGGWRFLVQRPAGRAVVRVRRGKGVERIPCWLPTLLVELDAQPERKHSGRIRWTGLGNAWSVFDNLTARTALYACPLPNSYSNGHWCRGDVEIDGPGAQDLAALQVVDQAFVQNVVHTDHTAVEALSDAGLKRHKTILGALRGSTRWKGRIRPEDLKPVTTLGDVLDLEVEP